MTSIVVLFAAGIGFEIYGAAAGWHPGRPIGLGCFALAIGILKIMQFIEMRDRHRAQEERKHSDANDRS